MRTSRLNTLIWLIMGLCGVPVASRSSAPLVMLVSSEQAPAPQKDQHGDKPRPARIEDRKQWQDYMAKHPSSKKGCFKAEYPSTEWKEVRCGKAPTKTY